MQACNSTNFINFSKAGEISFFSIEKTIYSRIISKIENPFMLKNVHKFEITKHDVHLNLSIWSHN